MLSLVTTDKTSTKTETTAKTIKDMLIDSLIISIIAVFSLWTGQTLSLNEFLALVKAFVLSFVMQFAYYKGIKTTSD